MEERAGGGSSTAAEGPRSAAARREWRAAAERVATGAAVDAAREAAEVPEAGVRAPADLPEAGVREAGTFAVPAGFFFFDVTAAASFAAAFFTPSTPGTPFAVLAVLTPFATEESGFDPAFAFDFTVLLRIATALCPLADY